MVDKCERCGGKASRYLARTAVDAQGQQFPVYMCPDCYSTCRDLNWVTVEGKGRVNLVPLPHSDIETEVSNIHNSLSWTGLLKYMCIALVVIATLAGFIIGVGIGEVAGAFIGGIIGFIGSMVAVVLAMVICEISTTLREILAELRKSNKD